MKTKWILNMWILLYSLAATWPECSRGGVVYEVMDIGEGPYPTDVSDSGSVLMSTYVLVPDLQGSYVRWNLDALHASRINEHGDIVGHTASQAYIWSPMILGGYGRIMIPMTWAFGINDACHVAGCYPVGGYYHPFVWLADRSGVWQAIPLGTLGGQGGYALDIDEAGEVCGYAWTASDNEHGFYWSWQTGMVDLGTLGGSISRARAINNHGEVTGSAFDQEERYHPFFWSLSAGMVDVGTLGGSTHVAKGYGLAINDHSQVVGSAFDTQKMECAIVWSARNGLRDLNTLIDPALGIYLERATANNNRGLILTRGYNRQGATRVFLLRSLDRTGPIISLRAGPVLWPANHRLQSFHLGDWVVSIEDDQEGMLPLEGCCRIARIYSDEPEDASGQGDGTTLQDIQWLDDFTFCLRAERSSQGNGRVYGVCIEAWDTSGNVTEEVVRFVVPLSRMHSQVVDDGPEMGWTVEAGH